MFTPTKRAIGLTVPAMFLITLGSTPAIAHKVKISGEIGATKHIEPSDTPRAGEPSLVWFALTRQGGEQIPLGQCNCRLTLYPQPYQPGTPALAELSLRPISAEGFSNIPGATVTFPQVGAYVLVLRGAPKTAGNFQPFELRFDVTVAAGQPTASPLPTAETATPASTSQTASPAPAASLIAPAWAIGLSVLAGIGILGAIAQRLMTAKRRPQK
ncbi:MAG TPA: hypothetical protein IGS37_14865 [Synechococcales cyanobacterium M55_K2018_004]|nr:hypothetical protein [Synechococcales cyanobacterium M55_K2018_004]